MAFLLDLDSYPIAEINQELKQKIGYGFLRDLREILEKRTGKSVRSLLFDKSKFDKAKAEAWLKNFGVETVDFSEDDKTLNLGVRKQDDFLADGTPERVTIADGIEVVVKLAKPEALKAPVQPPLAKCEVTKAEDGKASYQIIIPILKIQDDKQLVYGPVYEPDVVDAQGDSAGPAAIEEAAHRFSAEVRTLGIMHKSKDAGASIVESYIAPVSFQLNNNYIRKGTWILVTKIHDAALWNDIKTGKITGYSMGGRAQAEN
jgi:hypothetical protein